MFDGVSYAELCQLFHRRCECTESHSSPLLAIQAQTRVDLTKQLDGAQLMLADMLKRPSDWKHVFPGCNHAFAVT